jgi:predicted O-methyltransferase YrrM
MTMNSSHAVTAGSLSPSKSRGIIRKFGKGLRSVNLASFRLLSRPQAFADFLHDIDDRILHFTSGDMRVVDLSELVGTDTNRFFIPSGHIRWGAAPPGDQLALAALAAKKNPRRIFEIGTFEGLTSVVFAQNSPNATVSTLDLPHDKSDIDRTERSAEAHSVKKQYRSGFLIDEFGCGDRVQRLYGDSALFDFTPFHGTIDFFFVDGAHTEDYAARDTYNAFRCRAQNGWIVWHDCFMAGVLSVLKRLSRLIPVYQIRDTNIAITTSDLPSDSRIEQFNFPIR